MDKNIKTLLLRNKIFKTSVFKHLLSVPKQTKNLSILLELGRYPITLNMQFQTIKYFLRFPYLNKNRILYKSYEEEIKLYEKRNTNFISYVTNTLNNMGMSNIWITQIRTLKVKNQKNALRLIY